MGTPSAASRHYPVLPFYGPSGRFWTLEPKMSMSPFRSRRFPPAFRQLSPAGSSPFYIHRFPQPRRRLRRTRCAPRAAGRIPRRHFSDPRGASRARPDVHGARCVPFLPLANDVVLKTGQPGQMARPQKIYLLKAPRRQASYAFRRRDSRRGICKVQMRRYPPSTETVAQRRGLEPYFAD